MSAVEGETKNELEGDQGGKGKLLRTRAKAQRAQEEGQGRPNPAELP